MTQVWKILSILILPILLPLFVLYTLATGTRRRGLIHHLGMVPCLDRDPRFQKTLWLFALSVGEVRSAVPVLKNIYERRPDVRIVVSVTTDAGYDAACKQLDFAQAVFFNPLDLWPLPWIAAQRIRPDVFVLTETGFWPGQLEAMAKLGVPSLLFQGRISNKTMRRYRIAVSWAGTLLDQFEYLGMQSEDGVNKIKALGVDARKVKLLGNTKFDGLRTLDQKERDEIRHRLSLPKGIPVFVSGSTHEGEEEVILDAFGKLKEYYSTLTLILAPRRLERLEEIERLLNSRDLPFMKSSEIIPGRERSGSVILLDTMGELASIYAVARAAFVGKSLLPPGGGHSLLEPIAQGVPVLHGPYIEYQEGTIEPFKKQLLISQVKDAGEIDTVVGAILACVGIGTKVSKQGSEWIKKQQGASSKIADIILNYLSENDQNSSNT